MNFPKLGNLEINPFITSNLPPSLSPLVDGLLFPFIVFGILVVCFLIVDSINSRESL
ncbi:hypothetical protein D1872_159920 [compost metagenome]